MHGCTAGLSLFIKVKTALSGRNESAADSAFLFLKTTSLFSLFSACSAGNVSGAEKEETKR